MKTSADSVLKEAFRIENMDGHDLKNIMPPERDNGPTVFLSRVEKEIHEGDLYGGGNGKNG